MTWFHLVLATGIHVVFPADAIVKFTANVTDGTQSVWMLLSDGSTYELTLAQAQKIIGTVPPPL